MEAMALCRRCLNKEKRTEHPAVQEVCLDFGMDFDWEPWCQGCIDEEIALIKSRYTDGNWSAEDMESAVDMLLMGPHPATDRDGNVLRTYGVRYPR